MIVKVHGSKRVFKILGLLPFDHVRKIMSIVVETPDGRVILFSKGADQEMLSRCTMSDERKKKIRVRIDKMANKSLRVLVLAMRVLDQNEVE